MQKRDVVAFGKFNRSREYVFNLLIVREERDINLILPEIPVKFLMNVKSFNRKEKDERKNEIIANFASDSITIRYHVRKKLMQ